MYKWIRTLKKRKSKFRNDKSSKRLNVILHEDVLDDPFLFSIVFEDVL